MKKLILGVALAVAGVQLHALADDSILYWQIPTDGAADAAGYSYAALYANVDGGGEVSLMGQDGATFVKGEMGLGYAAYDLSLLGSSEVASFFVEYFNDQNVQIGKSSSETLATLARLGYIENRQSNPPVSHTGVWAPNYMAVPEPTSGLLLLLGVAGLALRRKRA